MTASLQQNSELQSNSEEQLQLLSRPRPYRQGAGLLLQLSSSPDDVTDSIQTSVRLHANTFTHPRACYIVSTEYCTHASTQESDVAPEC